MPKAERSVYSPLDFAEWKSASSLSLTPKFQRRGVWKSAARSFFIDTLLRGMPVPPIYLRVTQAPSRSRVLREVVDGQQRISAVLSFMEGEFRLSRTLKANWGGKSFAQLSKSEQDLISTYSLSVEVFHGISDLEVLEIFSRLNTYSVALNAQELRNGRFFGRMKQLVYELAYEHLEFWRRHRIFTEQNIARMLEVEFVSEVLIAFLAGMQDKKSTIDQFYAEYDETFAQRDVVARRFREVVDDINDVVGDSLADSAFKRPPLLYSLFCAIYHRRYGLPLSTLPTRKKPLTSSEKISLREAVGDLSDMVEIARAEGEIPKAYAAFVAGALRQTDNIKPRNSRLRTVYKAAFPT